MCSTREFITTFMIAFRIFPRVSGANIRDRIRAVEEQHEQGM